jgi:flagellar motor protein MotB
MTADALNIVGLVLGVVGSWASAYQVLWGFPKRNRLVYVNLKLENAESTLQQLEQMTDQLSPSVYSPQAKESIKEDYRRRAGIAELKAQKEALTDGHESRSFALASIGMLLLSVGFAAQLLAALLPKPLPVTQPPHGEQEALLLSGPVSFSFADGSATEPSSAIKDAVCELRRDLSSRGIRAAVVVGHYDWRDLRGKAKSTFRDNVGLAQQRADRARELLLNAPLCEAPPLANAIAATGGSRGVDLASDRIAEVFGIFVGR